MNAVLLSLTLYFHQARGYGSGAPGRQCDRMYPGHGLAAQFGPSPYTINLSQNTFGCPRETITITVTGSEPFTGFLCEPRPNPEVYATSGILSSDGSDGVSKQDQCGGGKSLTHTNNENKTTITFKWRPTTADNVYMVCTMVRRYRTFWVKQRSEVLMYVKKDCTNPGGDDSSGTGGGTSDTEVGATSSGSDPTSSGGGASANTGGIGTDSGTGGSASNSSDTSTNQNEGGGATDTGSQPTSGNAGSEGSSTGAHSQSTPTPSNGNNIGGNDKNTSAKFTESCTIIFTCVLCTLILFY